MEVARIEIETERRMPIGSLEGPLCGEPVVSNAGRVEFHREAHAVRFEHVKDRLPSGGERAEVRFELGFDGWREPIEQVPDRRTGQAGYNPGVKVPGRDRRAFHRLALVVTAIAAVFRSASYRDPTRSIWTGLAWQDFLRPVSIFRGHFEVAKTQPGSERSPSPPVPPNPACLEPIANWPPPIDKDMSAEARILPFIDTWARA